MGTSREFSILDWSVDQAKQNFQRHLPALKIQYYTLRNRRADRHYWRCVTALQLLVVSCQHRAELHYLLLTSVGLFSSPTAANKRTEGHHCLRDRVGSFLQNECLTAWISQKRFTLSCREETNGPQVLFLHLMKQKHLMFFSLTWI